MNDETPKKEKYSEHFNKGARFAEAQLRAAGIPDKGKEKIFKTYEDERNFFIFLAIMFALVLITFFMQSRISDERVAELDAWRQWQLHNETYARAVNDSFNSTEVLTYKELAALLLQDSFNRGWNQCMSELQGGT